MTAFIIEVSGRPAGVLASDRKSFRFHASDPSMRRLDGEIFRSPAAATDAAQRILTDKQSGGPDAPKILCRRLF